MSIAPFTVQAASACPPLDSLLLAAAAEFRSVDSRRVRSGLEHLAARLHADTDLRSNATEQSEAMLRFLIEEGLRPSTRVTPDDLMIDRVVERGEGHPVIVAAICVEVGRRAGLRVAPIGSAETVLVGIRDQGGPVVIDVAGEHEVLPSGLAWQCSHEVAFATLTHLARLQAMHGRVAEAIRAAKLRSALPVTTKLRRRIEFETGALRAQLN